MYKLLIGMLLSAVSLAAAAGADFRLADAVMRADRDTVRSLLQQKIDVNVAQPDGTNCASLGSPPRMIWKQPIADSLGRKSHCAYPLRRDAALPRLR